MIPLVSLDDGEVEWPKLLQQGQKKELPEKLIVVFVLIFI